MIQKLLYLTYIPIDDAPTSGSSVRPQKMRVALENLNLEVKTFDGINNNIAIRTKTVSEVRKLLKTWKPDACYIEPPSGPMFYYGDVNLIRHIHKIGIPISIFYRDAYWKYPEYSNEGKASLLERSKRQVIKGMQIYQWNVFKKNTDIIYFPSVSMAKEFDCPHKDVLSPGGFVPDNIKTRELSMPLQFIFVGGAAKNHGTFLTVEAFEKLNKSGVKAKLFYICPKEQWDGLGLDKKKYADWLEVIHTSGDQNLKRYYENADIAILTAPRTFYRDFAVPIKIYEYISYLKPILVTDCTETARIVMDDKIGWVTKDNVDSVVEQLEYLCANPKEIINVKENMETARSNNLWSSRAEKVINDLNNIQEEK